LCRAVPRPTSVLVMPMDDDAIVGEAVPLEAFGLEPRWQEHHDAWVSEHGEAELGRVVRQDRGFVQVATSTGQHLVAVRTRKTGRVLVGDWVAVTQETVMAVHERTSLLARHAPHGDASRYLVANIDLVMIVCGADRPLRARRVERAITQTREAGAEPVVVLTKADLTADVMEREAELRDGVPAVEVCTVSSRGGFGLDELEARMRSLTSVMVGESGAGKSTLLNALLMEERMLTSEVRSTDGKGRHTTTHRELHLLPGGGSLIDTPGVRALGLWADVESVDDTFPDIAAIAEECRFADCAHESEPGCAIRAALDSGSVDPVRVASWRALIGEVMEIEARRVERERRMGGKRQWRR
jgi:ribosome biogenesis GTPase